jgi:hypothetical protein
MAPPVMLACVIASAFAIYTGSNHQRRYDYLQQPRGPIFCKKALNGEHEFNPFDNSNIER